MKNSKKLLYLALAIIVTGAVLAFTLAGGNLNTSSLQTSISGSGQISLKDKVSGLFTNKKMDPIHFQNTETGEQDKNNQYQWIRNLNMELPTLNDIAYGNGMYVTVGQNGLYRYSTDGNNWITDYIPACNTPSFIHFLNGNFIAGGSGTRETIFVSSDGLNWTSHRIPGIQILTDLIWDGSRYIAICYEGLISSSEDLNNWTTVEVKPSYDQSYYGELRRIASNGSNKLVALTDKAFVFTSSDAIHWQESAAPFDNVLGSVIWTGSEFVISSGYGGVFYSLDGDEWTYGPSDTISYNMFVINKNGGNVYYSYSGSTSQDGMTWTPIQGFQSKVSHVVFEGNSFTGIESFTGNILRSNDFKSWSIVLEAAGFESISDIYHTKGIYVAVDCEGKILVSNDGKNWDKVSSYTDNWYGPKKIFLIDDTFYILNGRSILKSQDGRQWTRIMLQMSNSGYLYDMVKSPLGFYAVGSDYYAYSVDGNSWKSAPMINPRSTSNWYKTIACNDSIIVACGVDGTVMTMEDGTKWIGRNMPDLQSGIIEIIWNGARFVAITGSAEILTSEDGKIWTVRQPPSGAKMLRSLMWDGQQFSAYGNGFVYQSQEGLQWTETKIASLYSLSRMVYMNGYYYALNLHGSMSVSEDGINFSDVSVNTTASLFAMATDGASVLAVGNGGTIVRKNENYVPSGNSSGSSAYPNPGEGLTSRQEELLPDIAGPVVNPFSSRISSELDIMSTGNIMVKGFTLRKVKGADMISTSNLGRQLNMTFAWNEEKKAMVGMQGSNVLIVWPGSNNVMLNGRQIKLKTKTVMENGEVMIPKEFLSKELGVNP